MKQKEILSKTSFDKIYFVVIHKVLIIKWN